ncbi:hypothetical protein BCR32DRAFT_295910 [Anaeromyces robustus]|uniref:Uncharacterized protein n=1 Tax=Anaeromyces robustus TaxID=1754192 RepID=A0A1Y1WUJ1_9FUNG|nr:hypothetical protein BCR32DRAFT_295910 [Anaeromyces robustus]|eukprot:ORX76958.1 hypothetical protein BCR32DRAFT_295910 [Anaeromyces robustus]
MLSTKYISKKSAAINRNRNYSNINNGAQQYINTEEDPFIIRNQIKIPITSRYKEPNPERYGNTICDNYIEFIPKSKVEYKKIYPSFSTRDSVHNFRIQNESSENLFNENDKNSFIRELPVYLCFSSENDNNEDPFQNRYKMTFQIEFQNELKSSFSCLISIKCLDADILFNYQYHLTPYSYRSFINKHIITDDIKKLAKNNLYLSFKKYVIYLKQMIDNCIKLPKEYKARVIIPENSDNEILKFIISNHQEQFIYFDILSLYLFHSPYDKIYKDINYEYMRIQKLHKTIKSQLVRFANSVSIHAPSVYINELKKNKISVNRDYNMKSRNYWMKILDNCFNNNEKDININHSEDIIKLFDNNNKLEQENYIISEKNKKNLKYSFKWNQYDLEVIHKSYTLEKDLINLEFEFQYELLVNILIKNNLSTCADNNYYITIMDNNNVLFYYISEELNDEVIFNMMNNLHIRLIHNKKYIDQKENNNNNENSYSYSIKVSIKSIIKEFFEKSKDLDLINEENFMNNIGILNLNKSNNSNIEIDKNVNYGKLFIIKSTFNKQQIVFKTKIRSFPKEILSEYIMNKYYILSEEINASKIKVYTLIDAIKIFNNNIFKYVDLPSWSLDYAKGFQKKKLL